MSKKKINKYIDLANQKMSSYVYLLDYRYKNLPIKAEPVSLLSIEIMMDGQPFKMEEVAVVTLPEWNQLMLHPLDEEYIPDICKSVLEAHPEFKVEVTRYLMEAKGEDERVVLLTMPEVDDERYKLLTDGVKSLAEQCRIFVDKAYADYEATAPARLAGLDPMDLSEAHKRLDETHDKVLKNLEQTRDTKQEEIEHAHDEYLKKHADDAPQPETPASAPNPDPTFDDDPYQTSEDAQSIRFNF